MLENIWRTGDKQFQIFGNVALTGRTVCSGRRWRRVWRAGYWAASGGAAAFGEIQPAW